MLIQDHQRLAAHGWLHGPADATHYDRSRALLPGDVVPWVQTSQPHAWQALTKARVQKAAALLQERRTALISAAVTGQIDVRNLGGSLASQ